MRSGHMVVPIIKIEKIAGSWYFPIQKKVVKGLVYEWYCEKCDRYYHQEESFGDEKSFREWIKQHKRRHKRGEI